MTATTAVDTTIEHDTHEGVALTREAAAQLTADATNPRDFDTARRGEAQVADTPLERTAVPGLWVPSDSDAHTFLASLDTRTGRLALVNLASGQRSTMPVHTLPVRLGLGPDAPEETPPVQLVFATRVDLHGLAGYARTTAANMPDGPQRVGLSQTARIVDAAMSMPMEGRVAALTDALANKYYLPSNTDPKSLSDWARAFSLGGESLAVAMRGLAELATLDSRPTSDSTRRAPARNPMATPEFHALSSAAYGSSGMSAVRAHRSADRVQEILSGLLRGDAELLPRNVLTGDVSRVEVFTSFSQSVTGTVSQPFVMKPGRKVEVMFPDRLGLVGSEATIAGVKVASSDDSELVVTLQATRRHIGALLKRHEFYIYQAPFDRVTASRGQRWLDKANADLPEVPNRDIPLDVILAGAPT